jgi:hypothetical protein
MVANSVADAARLVRAGAGAVGVRAVGHAHAGFARQAVPQGAIGEIGSIHPQGSTGVPDDALDLRVVALWLGLKGAGRSNGAAEERLLLEDAGDEMRETECRRETG